MPLTPQGDNSTKLEWAHDTAWRFMPAIYNATTGYQLHAVDLAINKVLALAGRDEPRDFLDVILPKFYQGDILSDRIEEFSRVFA
ncbi:MAG: hypothetical protein IT291_09205 [Deltaproteobacteria bacterium]|nr:hypothetical protein [Deltaproteobacteria bacterium]